MPEDAAPIDSGIFTEEAPGVYSWPMLQPSACARIIADAEAANAWVQGKIARIDDDGKERHELDLAFKNSMAVSEAQAPAALVGMTKLVLHQGRTLIPAIYGARYAGQPLKPSAVQVNRYTEGGVYQPHFDIGLGPACENFSLICYLNTEYLGGQTYFPDLGHLVTPLAGKAILFRSEMIHGSVKIAHGAKYIIVSWLGVPRSAIAG